MALISSADLVLVKSAVVNDTTSNGGRMGSVLVASGVAGSMFRDANPTELAAGDDQYRKAFYHNRNAANETAYDLMLFVENYTPGGDDIVFFAATQTDVQDDIAGTEDLFGCAKLHVDIAPGALSIQVQVHDWTNQKYFRNGELIRISDKATYNGAGNTEFVSIHASTAITAVGNVVTIPLASAVLGTYDADDTRVASVLEYGDVAPSVSGWTETAAGSGTYDETTYPVTLTNKGTIEQAITVTFTSATAFNVTSDVLGSLGSGVVGSNFSPTNTAMGAAYFTLLAAGWGGTWQSGDTVAFDTHPAAVPLWCWRDIPVATAAESGNKAVLAWKAGSN